MGNLRKRLFAVVCGCLAVGIFFGGQFLAGNLSSPALAAKAVAQQQTAAKPEKHSLFSLISEDRLQSEFTDSDEYLCDCGDTPVTRTIQYYAHDQNHWHDSNIKTDTEFYKDNDIVKIIPKALFLYPGEYYYIGKEYGFYVVTDFNETEATRCFSKVMLFDVSTEQGGSARERKYRLTYLLYKEYWQLKPSDTASGFVDDETESVTAVWNEQNLTHVYMRNITASMSLINEYGPSNTADDGYEIERDGGCVLEQTRVNYHAQIINPDDRFDAGPLGKTAVKYSVNYLKGVAKDVFEEQIELLLSNVPFVSQALAALDLVKSALDLLAALDEGSKPKQIEVEADNERNIYTRLSKTEQLNLIHSERTKIHENKYYAQDYCRDVYTDFQAISLCDPGDYCEIIYVFSDTAEPARLTHTFSFDFYDERGRVNNQVPDGYQILKDAVKSLNAGNDFAHLLNQEHIKISYSDTKRLFARNVISELLAGEEFRGYMLDGCEQTIVFQPDYTGVYRMICSDPQLGVEIVDANGAPVTIAENCVGLKGGKRYEIKLVSGKERETYPFVFQMRFDPVVYSDQNLSVAVAAEDMLLIGYRGKNYGILNTLITAGHNVSVQLLDDMYSPLTAVFEGTEIVLSDPVDTKTYYLAITNRNERDVMTVLRPAASEIVPNTDLSNLRIDGSRWLSFTPLQTGTYQLKMTSDARLETSLFQPNYERAVASTVNSALSFRAAAGVAYRIKIVVLDADAAYANALATFAPESVAYGDNHRSMSGSVAYYSFAAETAAVYTFAAGDASQRIELLDQTTKPIHVKSSTGSSVTAALMEGVVFVKVTAPSAGALRLSIGVEAEDAANSEIVGEPMPFLNYRLYRLTTDEFSGSYRFELAGGYAGLTLFDANFRAVAAFSQSFDYTLDSAAVYYVKLAGDTGAVGTFEYWFDPAKLYVRQSVRTLRSYYVFEAPEAQAYRFTHVGAGAYVGQKPDSLQLSYNVMDGQFRSLATNPATMNLAAGRYYIHVAGEAESHFSINYADPTLAGTDGTTPVGEGVLAGLGFGAGEIKNLVFTPAVSGSYEARLALAENDRYVFSFFVKNDGALDKLAVVKRSDAGSLIQVNVCYTMTLTAGKTYVFILESSMDDAANNFYFSVVRPGAVANSYYLDAYNRSHDLSSGSWNETATGVLAFGNTYRFYGNPNSCSAAVATPQWSYTIDGVTRSFAGVLTIPAATAVGTSVSVTLRIDRDERLFSFSVAAPYRIEARLDTTAGCRYTADFFDEYGAACEPPASLLLRVTLTERGTTAYANGDYTAAPGHNEIDLLGLPIFHSVRLIGRAEYAVGNRRVALGLNADSDADDLVYEYAGNSWTNCSTSVNWMQLDVSDPGLAADPNRTITIPSSVKAINILGRGAAYTGVGFKLSARTEPLIVNLADLSVTGKTALFSGADADVELRVFGVNTIGGNQYYALEARDLTLSGTGALTVTTNHAAYAAIRVGDLSAACATLDVHGAAGLDGLAGGTAILATGGVTFSGGAVTVRGGRGKDGAAGTRGAGGADSMRDESGYKDGAAGGNGATGGSGTAGGVGIDALSFVVGGGAAVTVYGGDGGNGKVGGAGGRGGDGVQPTSSSHNGGDGGVGGRGGNGGRGANGAPAVKARTIDLGGAQITVVLKGGNGGKGGAGGSGGRGANGAPAVKARTIDLGGAQITVVLKGGNGGKGGAGGSGGTGGDGGNGTHGVTGLNWGAQRNGGAGGTGGDGGDGGWGGLGGNGKSAYTATTFHNPSGKLTAVTGYSAADGFPGDGGRGGNGGDGGNWSGAGGGGAGGAGGLGGMRGDLVVRAASGAAGKDGVQD